jgi:hypothetical protein
MCSPNAAHGTYTMEAETITKGATSALKVLGQKHLEALCATLVPKVLPSAEQHHHV